MGGGWEVNYDAQSVYGGKAVCGKDLSLRGLRGWEELVKEVAGGKGKLVRRRKR